MTALTWHFFRTFLLDTFVGRSYLTLLLDTLVGHWHLAPQISHTNTSSANAKITAAPQITHTSSANANITACHKSTWLTFETPPDAFAIEESLTSSAQTVANGWTVAVANATFGEQSPTPRPPKGNGNGCYAFGKNNENEPETNPRIVTVTGTSRSKLHFDFILLQRFWNWKEHFQSSSEHFCWKWSCGPSFGDSQLPWPIELWTYKNFMIEDYDTG